MTRGAAPGPRYDITALWLLLMLGGALLDLCGVAALVAGLLSPAGLVPALAVGYGATTLGGLCAIGLVICQGNVKDPQSQISR